MDGQQPSRAVRNGLRNAGERPENGAVPVVAVAIRTVAVADRTRAGPLPLEDLGAVP